MSYLSALAALSAGFALVLAYGLFGWINKVDEGTERMREAAGHIKVVSLTFLKREYKSMIFVIVVLTAAIGFFFDWTTAAFYVLGAILSATAAFFGMRAAVKGNIKTVSAAAEDGMSEALKVAFRSGAVTGLCITGFSLFVIGMIVVLFDAAVVQATVRGLALGVSTVSLFSRIGGGVFAKAVNGCADPTGDRTVIGDCAGGNAAGTAGMGSDLLESYVFAIVAALILAPPESIVFPLMVCAAGVLASIAGIIFVRGGENTNPAAALSTGRYVSGLLILMCAMVFSKVMAGDFKCGAAVACGLAAGIAISKVTETYTSDIYRNAKRIVGQYQIGIANGMVSGLSTGLRSAVLPMLFIAAAILSANALAGRYGVTLAAVGMLSTACLAAAADAFAPVSGNASGIAEMSDVTKEVKQITENLNMAANTASTAGKGYITGAATFSAVAVFAVYLEITRLRGIDLLDPLVFSGLALGAILPLLFASIVINSVEKAGRRIMKELGSESDLVRCADVSAKAAFKSIITPGLLSVAIPVLAGIVVGTEALGGVLAGVVVSGALVAMIMTNSGNVLENAKRYIESGNHSGKRSKSFKAATVGKEAGEPLRDAAGPAVNVLIKLIMIISVMMAGEFVKIGGLL